MTVGGSNRRAVARTVAAVMAVAVLAVACGTDGSPPVDAATDGTRVPDDHGLSEATLTRVVASTVGIDGVACGRLASGSGFALTERLIVTAAHVIVGIDDIRVHTVDGREVSAIPVAFDPVADLAILDVADADLAPLPLTDSAPTPSRTGSTVR